MNDSAPRRPSGDDNQRPNRQAGGSSRPKRDVAGKPQHSGDKKPYSRDGSPARDGDRKPFSRDGRPPRDGDRKPYSRDGKPTRDGERKSFSRDGRPPRDGERKPYSRDGKPPRDGDRKPFSRDGRPTRDGERKPFSRDGERKPFVRKPNDGEYRPGQEERRERRANEPELENRFAGKELDRGVLRDLSSLSEDNALMVARHLEAAAFYADIDPARALQHTLAAKNRAARLAVVRESVGVMAYVNQDFDLALTELRAAQRISGSNDQIALIIDCLRAKDKTTEALKIARDIDRSKLPREARIDLAIVISGIRLDRGEPDRAYAELQIPELDPTDATQESVQLFEANAEVLDELGRVEEAKKWRRYAKLTLDHFTPEETLDIQTEYLEPEEDDAFEPENSADVTGELDETEVDSK